MTKHIMITLYTMPYLEKIISVAFSTVYIPQQQHKPQYYDKHTDDVRTTLNTTTSSFQRIKYKLITDMEK
jgi:hypothetical protein